MMNKQALLFLLFSVSHCLYFNIMLVASMDGNVNNILHVMNEEKQPNVTACKSVQKKKKKSSAVSDLSERENTFQCCLDEVANISKQRNGSKWARTGVHGVVSDFQQSVERQQTLTLKMFASRCQQVLNSLLVSVRAARFWFHTGFVLNARLLLVYVRHPHSLASLGPRNVCFLVTSHQSHLHHMTVKSRQTVYPCPDFSSSLNVMKRR